ncbi:MAG: methyltransferase type 11 [Bacteroidetes bacterium RIFCSPLOWO2_12_FULL_35_15]|nr:MAG: methyltransferase type 11 [Bacteroidetes bacterium RIFCSPLOWO2_12_FULL_35_15]
MNVKEAYNSWADQYDSNTNKTRDLEAVSLRATLSNIEFDSCLEIGCGTGKNTEWLLTKANIITAVDLSNEMLAKAKQKINSEKVEFCQADITEKWTFVNKSYDLVTFSLVLEHIENLDEIFQKVSKATNSNGIIYIGELHPFKQYSGTKARFDSKEGQQIVTCFNHNISDFTQTAKTNGFEIIHINEYFDENDRTNIPRILTVLLKKR